MQADLEESLLDALDDALDEPLPGPVRVPARAVPDRASWGRTADAVADQARAVELLGGGSG